MSLKFAYSTPTGEVAIVHAAPKDQLERAMGPMTDEEYRAHVLERSIPVDAVGLREILVSDIPVSREYRNAWVDRTKNSTIDICMVKIKDLLLAKLRTERNEKLDNSDKLVARAMEEGVDMADLKAKRKALRDSTNALKAVAVSGSDINSDTKLAELEAAVPVLVDIVP